MTNGDARQANLALVQRMYECFNRDDMDTIRNEIFARGSGLEPAGTQSGRRHQERRGGGDRVLRRAAPGQYPGHPRPAEPIRRPASTPSAPDTVVEVHRGRGTTTVRDASGSRAAGHAQRAQLHALPHPRRPDRPGAGLHERPARRRRFLQCRLPVEADPRPARLIACAR